MSIWMIILCALGVIVVIAICVFIGIWIGMMFFCKGIVEASKTFWH